jgi:hypothetical protein
MAIASSPKVITALRLPSKNKGCCYIRNNASKQKGLSPAIQQVPLSSWPSDRAGGWHRASFHVTAINFNCDIRRTVRVFIVSILRLDTVNTEWKLSLAKKIDIIKKKDIRVTYHKGQLSEFLLVLCALACMSF